MISNRKNIFFLLVIAIFYVLFFPTSIGGIVYGNMWMIKNISGILIAIWIRNNNIMSSYSKTLGLVTMFILWFFTIWGAMLAAPQWGELRVAWASVSGFLPSCLLWCITFKKLSIPSHTANKILLCLSVILIIWGWGLVFTIPFIERITTQWYSSISEDMLANMLSRGKPVMSFGTHSVSAFFITIFFYLHCIALRHGIARFPNYVCMVLLFVLVIPMTSNTALAMLFMMTALFMWSSKSNRTKTFFVFLCIIIFYYLWHKGFISEYIDGIVNGTNSEAHGIEARYQSENYAGNIEVIQSIGGIGFLRSNTEFFEMRDSGFIYLMTQGNIFALCVVYILRFNFIRQNQQQYAWITILLFFLLEYVTASAYISVKIVFAEIMVMLFVNSFISNNPPLHPKK